jgi:Helix-turn-helix domain
MGTSDMADDAKKELEPPFLNTVEAAAWLRLTKNTLEKMRVQGRGPVYRKHGRYVRYHIEDLVDYSKANQRSSTSDAD